MKSIDGARNKRGRPPVGSTPINLRLAPAQLGAVDDWRRLQDDLPTRPEAVRRLIDRGLAK
jgi:hypothetical protein